ncbi:MAG: glycosyltransferase family 4 protein, partial [Candidatus Magasanikbacteria bacterium]
EEIIMPYPDLDLPIATRFVRQLLFYFKYRNDKFDIVHWFQSRLYPFFWLVPAEKIVVTAHDAGDITFPSEKRSFYSQIYNFVFKNFTHYIDAIIGVSNSAKEEIVKHYNASKEKVFATYLGGSEDFQPLDKESSQQQIKSRYGVNPPFLLALSRPVLNKNVDNLVKAFEIAKEQCESPHQLVIVGGEREAYGEKFEYIDSNVDYENLKFVDYVEEEDLNALYSAADALVFPSLNEGFGLPIVESMASGTPVITSNVTSMPEVAGDSALLVDPNDPKDIADKIRKLITDKNLQKKLIEKGLKRSKNFTWDNTVQETFRIYKKILSK